MKTGFLDTEMSVNGMDFYKLKKSEQIKALNYFCGVAMMFGVLNRSERENAFNRCAKKLTKEKLKKEIKKLQS